MWKENNSAAAAQALGFCLNNSWLRCFLNMVKPSPKRLEDLIHLKWVLMQHNCYCQLKWTNLCLAPLLCFVFPFPPCEGVTLRPDVYGDRGLKIYYNVSDNKTWEGLVTTLHNFLAGKNEVSCITLKKGAALSPVLGQRTLSQYFHFTFVLLKSQILIGKCIFWKGWANHPMNL